MVEHIQEYILNFEQVPYGQYDLNLRSKDFKMVGDVDVPAGTIRETINHFQNLSNLTGDRFILEFKDKTGIVVKKVIE